MLKKKLVAVVIVLLLGISVIPNVIGGNPSSGKTIYVDDNGGADYTRIQDAVDAASNGDTIYVFNGTYYENVVINKSLYLTGENKNSTIIDGCGTNDVVSVNADLVYIKEFTIQNGERGIFSNNSNNIEISNNIIRDNGHGIWFCYSKYSSIKTNTILNNNHNGIFLDFLSDYNIISGNCIISNTYAIDTGRGGIYYLKGCVNTTILGNSINNNICGISLNCGSRNHINYNNFFNNEQSATVFCPSEYDNWNYNFWDRPRFFPKPIFGWTLFLVYPFPILKFDWHPAQEPYDISIP